MSDKDNLYVQGPPSPPKESSPFAKLLASIYAGTPVKQSFQNVHGVAETRGSSQGWDTPLGTLDTDKNPMIGGKLEYRPSEYWGINLDGWRQHPNIKAQEKTGQHPYHQTMDVLSANAVGRYPNETGFTPYITVGPALMRTQEGDGYGNSPPSLDVGLHASGGIEKDLTDRLAAFLEAKYLRGTNNAKDWQGAYRGPFDNLGVVGGLTYRFGDNPLKRLLK